MVLSDKKLSCEVFIHDLRKNYLLAGRPVPVPKHGQLSYGHHFPLSFVVKVGRQLGLQGLVQFLVVLLHHGTLGDGNEGTTTCCVNMKILSN